MNSNLEPQSDMAKAPISRRLFLRTAGATALASIAASIPLDSSAFPVLSSASLNSSNDEFQKALAIADASSEFAQAMEELAGQAFSILPGKSNFTRFDEQPHLVGLMMSDTRPDPKKEGADIAVTIDLKASALVAVNYTVGRSLTEGLDITRVRFTPNASRMEHHALFSRDESSIFQSAPVESLVSTFPASSVSVITDIDRNMGRSPDGWTECTGWYYSSCCGTQWCYCCYGPFCDNYLRCVCNTEYRNCRYCYGVGACEPWYSEWRNQWVGCGGLPGCS